MMRKVFIRRNTYFATHYIYDDEAGHYAGILEEHDYGVRRRYYVGWRFDGGVFYPGKYQPGHTESFYTEEEAMKYILGGRTE